MEEQIFKIIRKEMNLVSGWPEVKRASDLIASMVIEFIKWLILENHQFTRIISDKLELYYSDWVKQNDRKYTVHELFDYWNTNIRNK